MDYHPCQVFIYILNPTDVLSANGMQCLFTVLCLVCWSCRQDCEGGGKAWPGLHAWRQLPWQSEPPAHCSRAGQQSSQQQVRRPTHTCTHIEHYPADFVYNVEIWDSGRLPNYIAFITAITHSVDRIKQFKYAALRNSSFILLLWE